MSMKPRCLIVSVKAKSEAGKADPSLIRADKVARALSRLDPGGVLSGNLHREVNKYELV